MSSRNQAECSLVTKSAYPGHPRKLPSLLTREF
jgi:hypothetical protein